MPQRRVRAKANPTVLVIVELGERVRQGAIQRAEGLGRQSARLLPHQLGREGLRLAKAQGRVLLSLRERARRGRGHAKSNHA